MRLIRHIATAFAALAVTALVGCGTVPGLAPAADRGSAIQAQGTNELYGVEDLVGIGPVYGAKLRKLNITSLEDFQLATIADDQRQELAKKADIPYKLVLTWAQQVDLMQIDGIGPRHAALLNAVGIVSVAELAQADAAVLAEKVGIANAFKPRFVGITPSQTVVSKWIGTAATMTVASDLESTLGLHPILVKKLNQAGIQTVADLEAASTTRAGREKLAAASGIPAPRLNRIIDKVQLLKIEGIGLAEYNLLAAVDVNSVKQLANALVDDLHYAIARANASTPRLVEKTPGKDVVAAWVEAARKGASHRSR